MKDYQQLTCEQRCQIYGLQKAGFKQREIANEVGVNKSTISRELRRNRGQRGWRPKQVQELRDKRVRQKAQAKRFSQEDWNKVKRMIRQDMTPEQVSARLKLKMNCQSAMKSFISTSKQTNWQEVICGDICAARNRDASAMQVGRATWHYSQPSQYR